mgnify:FL=1
MFLGKSEDWGYGRYGQICGQRFSAAITAGQNEKQRSQNIPSH